MSILDTITTPLWLRALPYLAGAATITAGLIYADMHGHAVEREHWQGIIAQTNADNTRELARLVQEARDEEHGKAALLHVIDAKNIKEKQDEITSRDRTIADLRSGAIRLRDKFTCHAGADQRVPSAAAATGQRDGASAGGLQREDVEFLVSDASRATRYARQLIACQATVRADRGQ